MKHCLICFNHFVKTLEVTLTFKNLLNIANSHNVKYIALNKYWLNAQGIGTLLCHNKANIKWVDKTFSSKIKLFKSAVVQTILNETE